MIAEDSAVLRDGLVQILTKRGHEVPAAVSEAESLKAAVAADPPDAVVLAIRIPPTHTTEVPRDALAQPLPNRGQGPPPAAREAESLKAAVAAAPPDAVVLDIRMPPTHTDEGLRAALHLREHHPGVGVLLFSQYIETRYARQLFADRAEGVGYLLKERVADVGDFVKALTKVAEGGTVLDPEVVVQLLGAQPLDVVTAREREVLRLMAE